jgi:MPBQ/MSBQ methyltransferase
MDRTTFASRYDATIFEPNMRALYGDSGYFNVGYWTDGVSEIRDACDRMVDEIASPIPTTTSRLLDVGSGLGAGTRRLTDRFPNARVAAVNLSAWQLAQARGRGVATTIASDAAQLGVVDESIDAITAIESPQHFNTRAAFFGEAHRVLRRGGVLSMADMLVVDPGALGEWMMPAVNRIESVADYERLLRDAGFEDVRVRDVIDVTWRPFCALMRRVVAAPAPVARALEESVSHYVLASARKR